MFKNKLNILVISALIPVFLQSCNFKTAKKIQNPQKKYEKALEYYELEKYAKTQILLEDVILSLRMTKNGENALYKYADSYFQMKDYILAGYHFRKYVENYPKNKNTEDAQFMSAKCYYLDAPKSKLDQQATKIALQEFEIFITKYPNSQKISECNDYVDLLRSKLELKSYENAKLYYDIGYYNAATIAFKSSIKEFPDTQFKEEIYYYIILSKYKYAKNSILTKQEERYNDVLSAYEKMINKFPESKYLKEITNVYTISKEEISSAKESKILFTDTELMSFLLSLSYLSTC